MKGGILIMLAALQVFDSLGLDQLAWQVMLNADKETGFHGSRDALQRAAHTAHAGMVYWPAPADSTLSRVRRGSGNFTLIARSRSAHAGREFEQGINAIAGLSDAMMQPASLSDLSRGLTVNVARINGGVAPNVVPDTAACQFNIRCLRSEDRVEIKQRTDDLIAQWNADGGVKCELPGMFTRPPEEVSPSHQLLMDWLQGCGEALTIRIACKATIGYCDGNNLADAGVLNIDMLGVLGGHIHPDQGFMLMDSLTERAKLSFSLLNKLATEGDQLITLQEAGHADS